MTDTTFYIIILWLLCGYVSGIIILPKTRCARWVEILWFILMTMVLGPFLLGRLVWARVRGFKTGAARAWNRRRGL